MSFSFYVPLDRAPTFEDTFWPAPSEFETNLGSLSGSWEDGQVGAVWVPLVTTRPVELSWENGEFGARILFGACVEDCTLALDLVCALAEEAGVDVVPEDGEPFPAAAREETFGTAWAEQHARSQAEIAIEMPAVGASPSGDAILKMPGALGCFYLGPRVRSWLQDTPDQADALFGLMREALHLDPDHYVRMNHYEVTKLDGTSLTATTYLGQVGQVMGPAEMILVSNAKPSFSIDRDALGELLGDQSFVWLDDRTWKLEALEPAAWEAFLEEARAHPSAVEMGDPTDLASGRSCLVVLGALGVLALLLYWWLG
ncbi:MAG: hypothetical protein AB8I08_28560 [Sandaracinaceae bacterium]